MPILKKWSILNLDLNEQAVSIFFLSVRPETLTGDHLILKVGKGSAAVVDHQGEPTAEVINTEVIKWASKFFMDYEEILNDKEGKEIVFELQEK